MSDIGKMNDFHADLKYSKDVSNSEWLYNWYREEFPVATIEFVTDLETQRKGIDKIMTLTSGKQITSEEKIRRDDYGDILLELWSNYENRTLGWAYSCNADLIVYIIEPTQKVYCLPVPLLQSVLWQYREYWEESYGVIKSHNDYYTSVSLPVPPDILFEAINEVMYGK